MQKRKIRGFVSLCEEGGEDSAEKGVVHVRQEGGFGTPKISGLKHTTSTWLIFVAFFCHAT